MDKAFRNQSFGASGQTSSQFISLERLRVGSVRSSIKFLLVCRPLLSSTTFCLLSVILITSLAPPPASYSPNRSLTPRTVSPTTHLFHSHTCPASPSNPLIIPAHSLLAPLLLPLLHHATSHVPLLPPPPAAYFASVAELHVAHMVRRRLQVWLACMGTRANKSEQ